MAYFLNENVYTHTFTPREYQVELLESSKTRNTIVCSSTSSAKAFLIIKLLQEYAWLMRNGGKKALLILDTHNITIIQSQIEMLTDLNSVYLDDLHQWNTVMDSNEVVLITGCTLSLLTSNEMEHIILLITDDCLYDEPIIDNLIKHAPRILALTASLLGAELEPDRLEGELQRLEILLHSKVDTSSEIVTLIRLSSRPKEKIIECSKINPRCALYQEIKEKVLLAKEFLTEHRFDPSEIYEAELLDELKAVPDPCREPLKLLDEFLRILEDLGVWAADYAAASILSKIEKLKVKVPYERHFLLLCMTSTVLVLIRAICDNAMQCLSEKEKVLKYSTSKIVRLLEVLKEFKPAPGEKPIADDLVTKMKSNNHQRLPARRIPYIQRTHTSEELLCALIFVNSRYTAKVLFGVLCVMSQHDEDFWWISASYSVEKTANPSNEPKEAEMEHKRQEEVLRKFRSHECNIMIATSVLEYGCDLPKCHLVIRFDLPCTFHSYIQSKARARAHGAHFISLPGEDTVDDFIQKLAQYNEVENTLLRRCSSLEPSRDQEIYADYFSSHCKPYKPLPEADAPSVTLSNAIALINRYCAKLPSDTFTKLTPIWSEECTPDDGYICSIRLPINSPVKTTVTSPRMESTLLARRAAAFMTCQLLHQHGELDDNLQPIGKENFIACEEDWNMEPPLEESEEIIDRPGTTKRRQYYYKKIADALLDCHPVLEKPSYFYKIVMTLTCPLPEEQNTRGRKIYPPENSPQGFGIITSKLIPKISAFPIFTRSGEVSVNLELCSSQIILNKRQMDKIREFVNYTFTSVLRLQKYLMLFDPDASCNSYLIVPTFQGADKQESIDWNFIDVIYEKLSVLPETIPVAQRIAYKFESGAYGDAVVMPWYRNQDQPQYFYVAEICAHLNPKSAFPGSEYATFEEYYMRKYNIQIQNLEQHLLDVDHTSARLNFLTPRYVNRKGVALPTSSEETKKAKRENLEQKQILVPELCAIHPFSASLWRKAVCLPCILYRINALLLADQIRRTVAQELGLGKHILPEDFKWPPLHFGWSLSDVLQKSKDEDVTKQLHTTLDHPELLNETKQVDELDKIGTPKESWDIGMWSNDMIDTDNMRYVSPTSSMNDFDDDFSYSESFYSSSDESEDDIKGYRIEFTGNFIAEAVETDLPQEQEFNLIEQPNAWKTDNQFQIIDSLKEQFHEACALNKQNILSSGMVVRKEEKFVRNPEALNISKDISECNNTPNFDFSQLFVTAKKKVFSPPCAESVPKTNVNIDKFSFDMQPNLEEHFGPSPNVLLQGLTMSNANDGINLERLETIGDSFLKYAITNYLYSKYENIHEGKLSHLRSKQVSNLNLYRLGKRKGLGEFMIATKFDPHDNWLPPCFYVPKELEEALQDAQYPANCWTVAEMAATRDMTLKDICNMVREKKCNETLTLPTVIPYNLVTQHSIPDKSIADCVEALIGAYLIECGPRGALLFMAWLGIRVLPVLDNGSYGEIPLPSSPLLRSVPNPEQELDMLLDGYHKFETHIGYTFNDRAYLLQALTHASYSPNKLTDCYQRLEFLGDAVLDYLITRHLYEDARMHSPGALTDLRSALVNNTIFASLAVRNGFHRYFRHLSPGLNEVVEKFIRLQEESGHNIVEELYLVVETESEEVEDVEVPKALGDVFESVAGAIFLDSQMSLDAVWSVYHKMMQAEIEQFSNRVPKSPIRELLELEPETAKFGKPEKLADGRRVRVTVEVFGKGLFKGIGRNYRIAKCTAAKCALKHLKRRGLINKRTED